MHNGRHTTDDDGSQPIAIRHLSDSGDLTNLINNESFFFTDNKSLAYLNSHASYQKHTLLVSIFGACSLMSCSAAVMLGLGTIP